MDWELDKNFGQTAEEIYNCIQNKIKKVTYEALEIKGKKNKMSWLQLEIRQKVEKKRKLHLNWF